jgi:hypothetical protein
MSNYNPRDIGTPDPLTQSGVWSSVNQPIASCNSRPTPNYPRGYEECQLWMWWFGPPPEI